MSIKFDMIRDVSPSQNAWTLLVRVVRMWHVTAFTDSSKPFSNELVLMDSEVVINLYIILSIILFIFHIM